jgi:hypothetical protein
VEVKDARRLPERLLGQESRYRQHAVRSDECAELPRGHDEGDQVDGCDAALQYQPA